MKKSLWLVVFLQSSSDEASGFVSTTPITCHHFQSRSCSDSELHDSLFDDIFESSSSNSNDEGSSSSSQRQKNDVLLPPKNYNEDAAPFSELESEQDRARRMEMVRELQKIYYKDHPDSSVSTTTTTTTTTESSQAPSSSSSSPIQPITTTPQSSSSNALSYGESVLRNLPTITSNDGIKTADNTAILPGYQFVWNIHNPQHCHMFHSILSGSAPWYFAHVHLEENQIGERTIDNIESYNDIQAQLSSSSQGNNGNGSAPPLYGTLLRITDRRFHDEDGRIVLAVQAIDKIRIHRVSSLPGTSPFLCTDVQLAPEEELMRIYFDKALMSSASFLSRSQQGGDHDNDGDDENNENDDDTLLSSPSAVSGAARAAAVADSIRCRKFECHPIFLEERPRKPKNIDALEAKSSDSNATRKIKDALRKKQEEEKEAEAYMSVVQLINYDAFAYGSLDDAESVTTQSINQYWENLARELKTSRSLSSEEDLFSGRNVDDGSSSSLLLLEEEGPEMMSSSPSSTSVEAVEMMEYHVWRSLDMMIRLLSMASAATLPLPSQLLGLLPKRDDWPKDFMLEGASTALEHSGSPVGTTFKSPFVRVDQITNASSSSSSPPSSSSSSQQHQYSSLRRSQRFSYVIWLLLDGLQMSGFDPPPPTRKEVLNMASILKRLEAAKYTIDGVNGILKQLIPKNENGG
jgi:hypothetical protein